MIMNKSASSRIGASLTGLIAALVTREAACASTTQRKESASPSQVSRNRAALERYYSALQNKNADELRRAIEEGFAPDAVLRVSDSLPYGGSYAGREVILEMLMGFV